MGAVQSSTSLDKEPALAGYLEMIYSRDIPEKAKEEKTEVMKENTLDVCFTGIIHHSKVLSADKGKI